MELQRWLAGRSPAAVFDLGPWVDDAPVDEAPADGTPADGTPVRVLSTLAGHALDEALVRPGRVRASARHLLAADALITYACEAALDAEDPEAELTEVLRTVSER